jgi:hypothetical protein
VALADRLHSPLTLAAGFAVFLVAARASAFCRTTTCDPKEETCAIENGCIIDGHPLYWREKCLSFGTQEGGSPLRGIPYATADHVFQLAFSAWTNAECDGTHPSFKMWDLGPIVCDQPEFNDLLPNANVWMFRDDGWPYENETETLALTTVLFEKSTGIILDADVEVNSWGVDNLTTCAPGDPGCPSNARVGKDLQAIATHEAGHFLGLSHSLVPGATMSAEYTKGDLDYRSLHDDDIAGICAIYPPDRDAVDCTSPHPAHGFSRYCGGGKADPGVSSCSFRLSERGGVPRRATSALFIAVAAGLGFRRRRSRRLGR